MGDFKSSITYPEILQSFRERRNEKTVLFPLMSEIKCGLDLEAAETCLSIGTGPGEYDIEFIKRCLPNLKKFIAVEKDQHCAAQLDANFQSSLPHLERAIHRESIETWKGPNCQVDVVLIFHMLYDLNKDDRKELFEKCFKSWLKPSTGVAVVIHMSDEDDKPVNVMQMIYREMEGWNLLLEAKDLKKEILSMNLTIHPEYKYRCTMDLRGLGADTLKCLHDLETAQFDSAAVERMLKKIAPDGTGKYIAELFAIKNSQPTAS